MSRAEDKLRAQQRGAHAAKREQLIESEALLEAAAVAVWQGRAPGDERAKQNARTHVYMQRSRAQKARQQPPENKNVPQVPGLRGVEVSCVDSFRAHAGCSLLPVVAHVYRRGPFPATQGSRSLGHASPPKGIGVKLAAASPA